MDFLDITTLIYPLEGIVCSVISNRARRNIQTTEAMFFLHPTPMHYNAVLAIKQDMKVTLIWCDSLNRDGQPALDRYSHFYHFLEGDVDWANRRRRFQPDRRYTPIWKSIPSPRLQLSPDKKTVPTVEYSPCYIKQHYTPGMEQQLDMNSRMLIASGSALTCTHGGTANGKMWNRSHPLWYTIRTWSEGGSNG